MILHTAKKTHIPGELKIYNSDNNLIATSRAKTKDGNIRQIFWYGGKHHGKIDLTEGGEEGMMEFIGENHER